MFNENEFYDEYMKITAVGDVKGELHHIIPVALGSNNKKK